MPMDGLANLGLHCPSSLGRKFSCCLAAELLSDLGLDFCKENQINMQFFYFQTCTYSHTNHVIQRN